MQASSNNIDVLLELVIYDCIVEEFTPQLDTGFFVELYQKNQASNKIGNQHTKRKTIIECKNQETHRIPRGRA